MTEIETVESVPRCEWEHRLETWPYTRRCQGEAVETVTLTDERELQVCALCALDTREGQFEDVTNEEEE